VSCLHTDYEEHLVNNVIHRDTIVDKDFLNAGVGLAHLHFHIAKTDNIVFAKVECLSLRAHAALEGAIHLAKRLARVEIGICRLSDGS
jgi:hypothetical protein